VQARLRPDRDLIDLLYAMFPGGSITGAPKIRAMEVIDEIEPVARGIGMGSIGYFGFDGSLDMNLAIRTMVVKDGEAHFSVGGGIVADSDPALEFEESLHKGAVLAHILNGGR
jgi:para-aminobenzoate synthetase component 1